MKAICATGPTCKTVDLSHHQLHVDWPGLKAEGVVMAIAKAGEGLTETDEMYETHISNAMAYGMMTGAYFYFHPGKDPVAQAKRFLAIAGKQKFMALDWETTDNDPTKADRDAGMAFFKVLAVAGKQKWLYTMPFFADALGLDAQSVADVKLWIAHPQAKCPLMPQPFKAWNMWQYSWGKLDHSVFNGTPEQLRALVG